jgi:ADP-heptose:LPS heptosyltransferase
MKYLINCTGFIGDTLFASSIAKKLHEQDSMAVVDYAIPLIQPKFLLEQNPYINSVYLQSEPRLTDYDRKSNNRV